MSTPEGSLMDTFDPDAGGPVDVGDDHIDAGGGQRRGALDEERGGAVGRYPERAGGRVAVEVCHGAQRGERRSGRAAAPGWPPGAGLWNDSFTAALHRLAERE